MINLGDVIGNNPLSANRAQQRALLAWRRIQEKPTSIVFVDGGTKVPSQTVRLEWDNGASASMGTAGIAPTRNLIIFGVKCHPSVADTIVAKGYTFRHDDRTYRVVSVIETIGEIQAVAETTG